MKNHISLQMYGITNIKANINDYETFFSLRRQLRGQPAPFYKIPKKILTLAFEANRLQLPQITLSNILEHSVRMLQLYHQVVWYSNAYIVN